MSASSGREFEPVGLVPTLQALRGRIWVVVRESDSWCPQCALNRPYLELRRATQ